MTPQQILEQAIAALEIERIMSADQEGNYTIEVTPKKILAALTNLRAMLEDMKQQEPVAETVSTVTNSGYVYVKALDRTIPPNTKLYTHPAPQPPQQEPVAWYRTVNGVKAGITWVKLEPDIDGWKEYPLYATPQLPQREGCEWKCDDDEAMPDTWDGACGAKWTFIEGGPTENSMRFCPECGKPVVLAAAPKPTEEK